MVDLFQNLLFIQSIIIYLLCCNRTEIKKLVNENQVTVQNLQEQVTTLETELAKKESELVQEKQVKEELINQSFAVAQSQDSERNLS